MEKFRDNFNVVVKNIVLFDKNKKKNINNNNTYIYYIISDNLYS